MGLAAIGKVLLVVLRSQYFWYVLAVAAVGYAAYDWAYSRGFDSRDAEVTELRSQVKDLRAIIEAERRTKASQQEAYALALAKQEDENKAALAQATKTLDAAYKANRQLTEKINARVPQFISPRADAACVLPRGFVRLHDQAADGTLAQGPAQAVAVPAGGPTNDDAASGVALSAASAVIAENYGECRLRGEVIGAWQSWYASTFNAWKEAVKKQETFTVTVPVLSSP